MFVTSVIIKYRPLIAIYTIRPEMKNDGRFSNCSNRTSCNKTWNITKLKNRDQLF